jgi:cysteine desulfurase
VADRGRLIELRERLERRVLDVAPEARVFGRSVDRLPNTSCIEMPGVSSEVQVMALDLEGIAVSAGSACSSGKIHVSHVLSAMGEEDAASRAIRASSGWTTTDADIDRFVEVWGALYARVGSKGTAARDAA